MHQGAARSREEAVASGQRRAGLSEVVMDVGRLHSRRLHDAERSPVASLSCGDVVSLTQSVLLDAQHPPCHEVASLTQRVLLLSVTNHPRPFSHQRLAPIRQGERRGALARRRTAGAAGLVTERSRGLRFVCAAFVDCMSGAQGARHAGEGDCGGDDAWRERAAVGTRLRQARLFHRAYGVEHTVACTFVFVGGHGITDRARWVHRRRL